MKKLFSIALLFSLSAVAGTPVEIQVPIDDIYAPMGFDSNDSSEIILEGKLPNLCHKSPMTKTEIVGNKINIKVTALKYDESNPF